MLKVNDSKEDEISSIFSENSAINTEFKNMSDFKSSSIRIRMLEEENCQLKKNILNLKIELNKKIEIYEDKLIKFKETNSFNRKYQQEILDLKKRLEISTKQNIDQKNHYTIENQKIRNNFENQILELQDKIESLQKKCSKYQQSTQSKDYEKSNLAEELQIQSIKLTKLLQSASNYFNVFFTNIDSFISYISNAQNEKKEFEENFKSEKKKRKSLEKKCITFNQEKLKLSEQVQYLTNQNNILNDEIESIKTNQEIEFNKKKMNQIKAYFDVENFSQKIELENKNIQFQQHQNQLEKVTMKQIDLLEKDEEKDEEIHNLHLIIIKLKRRNQALKHNLKLKVNEINSLQIIHSNLEEKFNEFESHINQKTNSKVKIMKLKRKIIDLTSLIENLKSEIIKLKCEHKNELFKNEILIKNLQSKNQSNSNSKVYSYSSTNSNLNANSNSFSDENQINKTCLDSSYCIDETVPAEISDSLRQIIENKGLKINLKIRLITKSLATYYNDLLLQNKNSKNNNGEDDIVRSFIEKVYNLILKQFISYQNFIDNKVIRKALLERAKELVSIAESQSNINLNQDKNSIKNFNSYLNIKKNLNIKNNSNSAIKKNSKNKSNLNSFKSTNNKNKINQNVSDIFSSNSNESQQSIIIKNSQNSELNTITHIESISQSQLDSKLQQNSFNESSKDKINSIENSIKKNESENEESEASLFEEEEEEDLLKDDNSDGSNQNKNNTEEEDIISEIESLVDDLKLKIE